MRIYALLFIATVAISFVCRVDSAAGVKSEAEDELTIRKVRSLRSLLGRPGLSPILHKLLGTVQPLQNTFLTDKNVGDEKEAAKEIEPITKKVQRFFQQTLNGFMKDENAVVEKVPATGTVPQSLFDRVLNAAQDASDKAKKLAQDLNADKNLKDKIKSLEKVVKQLSEGKGDKKKLAKTAEQVIDDAIKTAKDAVNKVFSTLEKSQEDLAKNPGDKNALEKYKKMASEVGKIIQDFSPK